MKGYEDQKYPVSVEVEVRWSDGQVHRDAIKGLNVGHALYLGRLNWPDAESVEEVN